MTDDLPMGAPNACLIFMNHLEHQIFNSNQPITKHIKFWRRYVDDSFSIWDGGIDLLHVFHNFINNFHKNISFTLEIENNNTLNFLDLQITKHNNTFTYNIYRKPTTTDTLIPESSQHPAQHKKAAFK